MNVTVAELSKLSKKTPALVAIFDDMGNRERFRREYNLKRLHKELNEGSKKTIEYSEFINGFKDMEEAGLGSLVIGRGGKEDRWLFNYNLKDIYRCAKGEIKPDQMAKLRNDTPREREPQEEAFTAQETGIKASTGGSALDVIIISPRGTGVERIRINPDKEKMFREFLKILTEK